MPLSRDGKRQRGSFNEAAGRAYQRSDTEADIPAIKLEGYMTSHKEIRDLYHSVYLLRRLPSPLPCGPQQRKEAIQDILSSLRNQLHRWGYPTTSEEYAPQTAAEPQSKPRRRENPHDEALQEAREAHQWALKAAHMLESDTERLSQWVGDAQNPHPSSCSTLGRCPRSPSRHQLVRRITIQEPEIELDPNVRSSREPHGCSFGIHPEGCNGAPLLNQRWETVHPSEMPMAYPDAGGRGDYPHEPSIDDAETWLDWQACQMDMP